MTLSMRPGDRGGLSSMEKWSNTGIGWGNHHQQVLNVLEPDSLGPHCFYSSNLLQQQSMFPQVLRSTEHDSAIMHAFEQATEDFRDANNNVNTLEYTLLKPSNTSSSMVESSTSDEEYIAPEIRMNCISALGGGPVSPVVANIRDRTGSTGGSMMAQEDFCRLHHPADTSPGGRSLSPCGLSDDSLHGAEVCETVMADLKRRFKSGDEEWIDQIQVRKEHRGEQSVKLAPAFHNTYDAYADAPSSLAGVSPVTTYDSRNPAPSMLSFKSPVLQRGTTAGWGASGVDIDSMRSILFRHVSQPVPSLEEIASSRPTRRNVRISKDPQSVAARHRRERISDRMRVLQRLVPGGMKMDTASMLDEAIHYVKFLRLQLQTLEQMGNNYGDALGSFVQPQADEVQQGGLARRPFNLNCATVFQAWPLNNNITDSNIQASQEDRQFNRWA